MPFMYPELPPKEEIDRYECVHASYVEATDYSSRDAVIVKENIHCKDGRVIPNVRIIENYKRDFYRTLDRYQTHKDKKSFEKIDRLRKFTCSQHELHNKIARSQGKPGSKARYQMLARDQYLYGSDIATPVLVKRGYRDRYPGASSPAKVAVYDVEKNMNSAEEEIIIAAMSQKKRARQCILESWVRSTNYTWIDTETFMKDLRATYQRLIGPLLAEREIELEIEMVSVPGKAVKRCFDMAHEEQPDYVTMFNIDADIPWSIEALEQGGFDVNEVFPDPRIPKHYRKFRYVKGPTTKKNADGEQESINVHDQWHTCENQASFILCCQMLLYKRIRTAAPNEPSYGLDAILRRNGLDGKLDFSEADAYVKREWHEFMQQYYPLEYCVYNLVDVVRCEQLDEKTNDIAMCLGALLKSSEYKTYNSQPKMVADDLHFFALKRGNVIGSTSDQMLTEIDTFTPNLRNWIVTLPSYMMADRDIELVFDMPGHRTNIETHVSDVDIEATYPKLQDGLNISKETTATELSSVEGFTEQEWRHAGIDLTGGFTNHTMFAQTMLDLPDMDTLHAEFLADLEIVDSDTLKETA